MLALARVVNRSYGLFRRKGEVVKVDVTSKFKSNIFAFILLLVLFASRAQAFRAPTFTCTRAGPVRDTSQTLVRSIPTLHASRRDIQRTHWCISTSKKRTHKFKLQPCCLSTSLPEADAGRNGVLPTLYPLLLTLLASAIGVACPSVATTLNSLTVVQTCLSVLMLSMGLAVTPVEFSKAIRSPSLLVLNTVMCFFLMPLTAVILSCIFPRLLGEGDIRTGLILLGCVSGGQASNLFALLAGGDAALSVVCTLITTLLGAFVTPLAVGALLGSSVSVDPVAVLRSVATLALLPLSTGLALGMILPKKVLVRRVRPLCPNVGLAATLVLVGGGASGLSSDPFVMFSSGLLMRAVLAATFLPLVGGSFALLVTWKMMKLSDKSIRTLVVETFSKSPTLAYVLARKHFDSGASSVPAAAMVTLGIIGAAVASIWAGIPLKETDEFPKYEGES